MAINYAYILIVFFLSFKLCGSEILYNKNDIVITKQDIDEYMLLHNKFNYANKNIIIKEIVLIKRTVNNLKKKNPKYFEQNMSQIISRNIKIDNVNQDFLEQNLFYINVRNDIAKEFMINKFKKEETKDIFKSKNIKLPLSKNECMTIFDTLTVDDLNIDEIYNIIDRKIQDFKFKKFYNNAEIYVCLSDKITNQLINLFNNYMIEKSSEDFLSFIYEKK